MQQPTHPLFKAVFFVAITFLISWTEQYFIIRGDGINNPVRAFALMWTPGCVGVFCSLYFDRNLKPLAIQLASIKSFFISYGVPAFSAILMVALLVIFRGAEFEMSSTLIEKKGSKAAALTAVLVMAPTIGMIVPFISGLGEELGWRGFLHSQFLAYTSRQRYFYTGVIWGIWHWPLIIFGDYSTSDFPFLNVVFFSTVAVGLSFFMGFMRDKTGSVFTAALSHASHNMWVLGIAPVFIKGGPLIPYLGGESGLVCAVLYMTIAVWIARRVERLKLSSV
jgi:membrane protease YdiL (CAAX protease family)